MSLLQQIQKGKSPGPRRILIYGQQGVGKSTFCSDSEVPIFIPTEDGLGNISCNRFPLAHDFEDVMSSLHELFCGEHNYHTIVLDSLDWTEKLIWQDIAKSHGVESIEALGYGKGYVYALTYWRRLLDALNHIRQVRGMTIILVAHAKVEKFDNPETESYNRYSPDLHQKAAALIMQWCDEVLFVTFKIHTLAKDDGFNKKRILPIGNGDRILRTTERPFHLAKNRLNLPDELPLSWAEYARYIPDAQTKQSPTLQTIIL